MTRLIFRLTNRNVSKTQIAAFALANLVGLLLIMLALQAYRDILPAFAADKGVMKAEYIVLTKPVSTLNSLFGANDGFTKKEVEELRKQTFVDDIGVFTPSQFQVTVVVNIPGTNQSYASEMFFEAVPDRYIDVDLRKWKYNEKKEEIPIILPRNYLNLYNFGFAQTKGLPKISEQMISMLPLKIYVARKQQAFSDSFTASIYGFTNRLNTILVPEEFIKEANRRYGDGKEVLPTRLIIKVSNPADSKIVEYLQQHNLQAEQDNIEAGRLTWFLQLIVIALVSIGGIVCALSFYLLLLSIFLLVQKNKEKIKTLRLLGYSIDEVAMPYYALVVCINTAVFILSWLSMTRIRQYYIGNISEAYPQITGEPTTTTFLATLALLLLIYIINVAIIRRNISRI